MKTTHSLSKTGGKSRTYKNNKFISPSSYYYKTTSVVLMALLGLSAMNFQTVQSTPYHQMQGRLLDSSSQNQDSGTPHKNCVTKQGYSDFKAQWQKILTDIGPLTYDGTDASGNQINVDVLPPPSDQTGPNDEIIPIIPPPNPLPPSPTETESPVEPIVPVIPPTAAPVTPSEPTTEYPTEPPVTTAVIPPIPPNVTTEAPTQEPTAAPTQEPTYAPIVVPTTEPIVEPTLEPTQEPTQAPTYEPTQEPTQAPTEAPTQAPTSAPTRFVPVIPSRRPTSIPSRNPTPSRGPTQAPTQAPSQEPTVEPIPTEEPPLGCLRVDQSGQCQQCNQYSYLDVNDNSCNCAFNYKVEIERHCDDNVRSDANQTYELQIYNHLEFSEEVFNMSASGEINCADLLLFIFADQETLDLLADQVDYAECSLVPIFYIVPPTGNDSYSNILHVSNLTQDVFNAFISGGVELAFDYSYIALECIGLPDTLVSYQGIVCGPEQQSYCRFQNQSSNNETGGEGPPLGASGDCQSLVQLSASQDENQTWTLNITNLPFIYVGEYIDSDTQQVLCSDIIFASENLTANQTAMVDYSVLLNCYAYQSQPSNNNNSNNSNNTNSSGSETTPEPSPAPTPTPSETNATDNSTVENSPTPSENTDNNTSQEESSNQLQSSQGGLVLSIQNMTQQDIEAFVNRLYILFINLTNFQQLNDLNCTFNDTEPFALQGSRSLISKCGDNCQQCDESTGMCDLCDQGYLLIPTGENNNTCLLNPCTVNQTYDIRSRQCRNKCEEGCAQCNAQGQCSQCAVDYFRLYSDYTRRRGASSPSGSFICVRQCPVNFFTDYRNRQCSICDSDCQQCQENMFYRCPFDAALYAACVDKRQVTIGGVAQNLYIGRINCQRACPPGFYGFDGWCHQCSSSCQTCSSFNQCLSCPEYSRLENQTCVQQVCEPGTFLTRQGNCEQCAANCSECSVNRNNCTACNEGFTLQNRQCFPQQENNNQSLGSSIICNPGQYASDELQRCLQCPQNCYTCNDFNDCTTCSPFSYKLVNETTNKTQCVSICPSGYYSSNFGMQCIKCTWANCQYCAPQNQCWTCAQGFYKGRTSCFSSCPVGQYLGQDFLKYYQCQTCPQLCRDCSSRDTCTSCQQGLIKVTSQFSDISEALVQKTVGQTCLFQGSQCPSGTFFNATRNQCILCPRGCAQCDNNGTCTRQCDSATRCTTCLSKPQNCTQCPQGQILIQGDGENAPRCQASCESNQFYDNSTQTCKPCLANCSRCSDQDTCQQCDNSTYLFDYQGSSQQCLAQCPASFYASQSSRQCQKCPKNCVSCTQGSRCDQCDSATQLDQQSGRCYCVLKYTAYLSSESNDVQVELQNIQWDNSVVGLFNPSEFFNCSAVFDFNLVNQTVVANDEIANLDNLQCSGAIAPDGNFASVTIFNVSQSIQSLIRNKLVQIALVKGSYHISCVQFQPYFLDILTNDGQGDYDVLRDTNSNGRLLQLSEISSGIPTNLMEDNDFLRDIDQALQEQGDQLKQLIQQNEKEDKFYQDIINKQNEQQQEHDEKMHQRMRQINIIIAIGVLVIIAVLMVRRAMKNKMRMVVYERQKSELEDDNQIKVIEMSKIKCQNNNDDNEQDKQDQVELLE